MDWYKDFRKNVELSGRRLRVHAEELAGARANDFEQSSRVNAL